MVLNLEKIVPSPYFRSYWVQQNITEMKQYSAAVTDLFRSGNEFREERVLIKKAAATGEPENDTGSGAVAEILRLVPTQTGMFQAKANPTAAECIATLETKILAPHLGPVVAAIVAPQVQLTNGETGAGSDLETRIDLPPVRRPEMNDTAAPIKNLLDKNRVRAILQLQSTERAKDAVFIRFHSAVVLLADSDWNDSAVRAALVDFARPPLTTGQLGVDWQSGSGFQQLNGLWTLAVATRGKYLFISDDAPMLGAILASTGRKSTPEGAVYVAGFNHSLEHENFLRFDSLLETNTGKFGGTPARGQAPDFFGGNVGSLSSALKNVTSEKIVVRESSEKTFQTVTYEWAR
jgi:hypothetical protein